MYFSVHWPLDMISFLNHQSLDERKPVWKIAKPGTSLLRNLTKVKIESLVCLYSTIHCYHDQHVARVKTMKLEGFLSTLSLV